MDEIHKSHQDSFFFFSLVRSTMRILQSHDRDGNPLEQTTSAKKNSRERIKRMLSLSQHLFGLPRHFVCNPCQVTDQLRHSAQ